MAKKKTATVAKKKAPDQRALAKQREAFFMSISKKEYCKLAGDRTAKQVNDPARKYGLPVFHAHLNLYDVLAAFHDLITEMFRQDITVGEKGTRPIDELTTHKARREHLRLLQDEGVLVNTQVVREMLESWASIIRQAGEVLDRQFGGEAHLILDEAISDCEKTVSEFLKE